MAAKLSWKGGALLGPLPPTMVTCGTMVRPNVLTVAWTGITNTIPSRAYISIRPTRYSYGLIKESGEFVINLTTADLVRAADFCGVRSGRDCDKFALCGLTPEPSTLVPGDPGHPPGQPRHVPCGHPGGQRGRKICRQRGQASSGQMRPGRLCPRGIF